MTYLNAYASELQKLAETLRPDDYQTGAQRREKHLSGGIHIGKGLIGKEYQKARKSGLSADDAYGEAAIGAILLGQHAYNTGVPSGVKDVYTKPRQLFGRNVPIFKKKRKLHYYPDNEYLPASESHEPWRQQQATSAEKEGYSFKKQRRTMSDLMNRDEQDRFVDALSDHAYDLRYAKNKTSKRR